MMNRKFLGLAAALAVFAIGCATSVPYGGSPSLSPPMAIPPIVADAMTKVCASLPVQSAGGPTTDGAWTTFLDHGCGDTGYLAGAAAAAPNINAAAPLAPPVLYLPGNTKSQPGKIYFVVDWLNDDGVSRTIQWRITPRGYYGTATGYDAAYPWNSTVHDGKKSRMSMQDNGNASKETMAVRLELRVPPGTKIGGWSGAINL